MKIEASCVVKKTRDITKYSTTNRIHQNTRKKQPNKPNAKTTNTVTDQLTIDYNNETKVIVDEVMEWEGKHRHTQEDDD